MGLMQLSAVLKQRGHTVDALIGNTVDDFLPALKSDVPDILGFSVMTGAHSWAQQLSVALKAEFPTVRTVWGGPHPTFSPEIIQRDGIDAICRGEGERALVELAQAVQDGVDYNNVKNLWVKDESLGIIKNELGPLIADLDSLPFPDRGLYARYPAVGASTTQVFMAGRGCPFKCTFCFDHQLSEMYRGKGKFVRFRSVRNLLDEIADVTSRMRVRNVYMNDDTFILNREWVAHFTDTYAEEVPIPFTCLIRADLADEGVIRDLKKAGCRSVFFGIETGNEDLRNGILKKKVSNEQIKNTARLLKEHRIKFRTYNILGLPGETLADSLKTVEMNIDIRTDYPWAAIFVPYPGTELAATSKEMGLLDKDFGVDDVDATFHSTSVLKIEHRNEIVNLHKFFQTAVLLPWTFPLIKRLIRLRPNRLFTLWFAFVYGCVYIRSEDRGWWNTLKFGMRNLGHLAPSLTRRSAKRH